MAILEWRNIDPFRLFLMEGGEDIEEWEQSQWKIQFVPLGLLMGAETFQLIGQHLILQTPCGLDSPGHF